MPDDVSVNMPNGKNIFDLMNQEKAVRVWAVNLILANYLDLMVSVDTKDDPTPMVAVDFVVQAAGKLEAYVMGQKQAAFMQDMEDGDE